MRKYRERDSLLVSLSFGAGNCSLLLPPLADSFASHTKLFHAYFAEKNKGQRVTWSSKHAAQSGNNSNSNKQGFFRGWKGIMMATVFLLSLLILSLLALHSASSIERNNSPQALHEFVVLITWTQLYRKKPASLSYFKQYTGIISSVVRFVSYLCESKLVDLERFSSWLVGHWYY